MRKFGLITVITSISSIAAAESNIVCSYKNAEYRSASEVTKTAQVELNQILLQIQKVKKVSVSAPTVSMLEIHNSASASLCVTVTDL